MFIILLHDVVDKLHQYGAAGSCRFITEIMQTFSVTIDINLRLLTINYY